MTKKMMSALVLIVLCVIVFIINSDSTSVKLGFTQLSGMKSFIFLAFTVVGVAIGVLLK